MIALLIDQNFNEHIIDGMIRRDRTLRMIHVRDVGMADAADPTILEWAAANALVLATHDRKTIPSFAYARVSAGLNMPGVFVVDDDMPIGRAIDELLIAVTCLSPAECRNLIRYFPL